MKIGDKVVINKNVLEYNKFLYVCPGLKGKIVDLLCEDYNNAWVGIEFDYFIDGHNCKGKGKPGHCYYMFPDVVDVIENENIDKRIEELEKEIIELKKEAECNKNETKYVAEKGDYCISGDGCIDKFRINENYKITGRTFDTEKKSEKARNIMVKHDIILKYVIDNAPDYNPDWNDFGKPKYYVSYDIVANEWYVDDNKTIKVFGIIYMPEWLAEKLADDLNNNRINLNPFKEIKNE